MNNEAFGLIQSRSEGEIQEERWRELSQGARGEDGRKLWVRRTGRKGTGREGVGSELLFITLFLLLALISGVIKGGVAWGGKKAEEELTSSTS